ncbi:ATP-binding protein [Methylibium sp.]|uniref:GAF domain-containing sensor histidine kinase n=1 Tax=Methylibium sp. TaxID=2067992 RepID=UPI00345B8F2A
MTGADSTGLSLEDECDGQPVFRWVATAGELRPHLHQTLPRDFSPCGAVVQAGEGMLMRDPARYFPYIEALGTPIQEVLLAPFSRAGRAIGTVWAVLEPGSKPFDAEDLRVLQSLAEFAGMTAQSSDALCTLNIARDTTERRLSEVSGIFMQGNDDTEHERVLRELQEADRRKDAFLATLGHELRNPLGTIRLATHLLQQSATEAQKGAIAIIERQSSALVTLIDDLTDLTSIRRGKVVLASSWINVQDVLAAAVEVARPLLEKHQHMLDVALPPAPMRLYADQARLTQVLANLLNNAAKYTPRGGSISVRAEETERHVELSVRDTGIGIDPSVLPTVFDMFMQSAQALDRAQGGLGIGLALVRQLVELHGGQVMARSEGIGKGSEFIVLLPRDEEAGVTGDGKRAG